MTQEIFIQMLAALGVGGAITEAMRYITRRDRSQADIAEIYSGLVAGEMQRMQREIDGLRGMVLDLSIEIKRLGGDPTIFLYQAKKKNP
jgi:hypothetical protein